MLSPKLLEALREHWRGLQRKPSAWLFPGNRWHSGDTPITAKVVWNACQQAARRAGLQKDVHPHTLRHYADLRIMPGEWGMKPPMPTYKGCCMHLSELSPGIVSGGYRFLRNASKSSPAL
jgi:hypothetical protein